MAALQWSAYYETGDPVVDRQHMVLFAAIGELHEAIKAGRGHEVVTHTLVEMVRYTRSHFRDEEAFMREMGYPQLEQHAIEHELLARVIMQIAHSSESRHSLSVSVRCFDWLIAHIRAHDVPMIEYARARSELQQSA